MADAQMQFLFESNARRWYFAAPGQFERPGLYFWDGTTNVHIDDALAAPEPASQEAVAWLRDQRGLFEGPQTLDPMLMLGPLDPGPGRHGATYSPLYSHAAPEPARAEAVPAGWKLAPVEPTESMKQAGQRAYERHGSIRDGYDAMLAAAPQPPKDQA